MTTPPADSSPDQPMPEPAPDQPAPDQPTPEPTPEPTPDQPAPEPTPEPAPDQPTPEQPALEQQMPEGWYDDPFTDHLQRYWTGASWTKQTRPRAQPPLPADPFIAPSSGPPHSGTTIVRAPAPPEGSPIIVRDYLVLSILSLVFCFWPLAIPAVYFAVRTYSAKKSGDIESALRYSDRARLFLILSVIAGLLVAVYLVWAVLGEGSGALGLVGAG